MHIERQLLAMHPDLPIPRETAAPIARDTARPSMHTFVETSWTRADWLRHDCVRAGSVRAGRR